jgi:hypothetical protein
LEDNELNVKKAATAYFKEFSKNFPGGTEEYHEEPQCG